MVYFVNFESSDIKKPEKLIFHYYLDKCVE